MADLMDYAQEQQAQMLEAQIAKVRTAPTGRNVFFCDDCGELIPNARRKLLPGVETCAPCQESREAKSHLFAGKA